MIFLSSRLFICDPARPRRCRQVSAVFAIWCQLVSSVSFAQLQEKATFFQTCDASAGVCVGGRLFAVASDEDNWLRIYDRKQPGPPLQAVNLSPLLGIAAGEETDIEGATQIGDVSYWIGSHGADKNGTPSSSRQFLFALRMELSGGKVSYALAGRPYHKLLDDLAAAPGQRRYDLTSASTRPPKDEGALNIEGLSVFNDELLIGFRNPIPNAHALLVPLKNPQAIMAQQEDNTVRAELGDPIELDLGGRGVRSIEYSPADGVFWIVAGSFDAERNFALYRWKGPGHTPRDMDVEFGEWNPEGLIVWPDRPRLLQILSDDGERTLEEIDEDRPCKKLPLESRRFRSGWVKLEE